MITAAAAPRVSRRATIARRRGVFAINYGAVRDVQRWSEDKNHLLKRQRGIAFEDVAVKIAQRDVVDLILRPPTRYGIRGNICCCW